MNQNFLKLRAVYLYLLVGATFGMVAPISYGQTTTTPIPQPNIPFYNSSTGVAIPCSGCSLYSYTAGTNTPSVTYTDSTGGTPNSNPIVLNSGGYNPAGSGSDGIWFDGCLKFVLEDASSVVIWTIDHVCYAAGVLLSNLAATSSTPSSNGAALVGYEYVAGIGSQAETVQAALDTLNKQAGTVPGIVCDGSTDTHAAINVALGAAVANGGGVVQLPPGAVCNLGTSGISSGYSNVYGVTLQANATTGSTLIYSGTGVAVQIGDNVNPVQYTNLKGIKIDISNAGTSATALAIYRCSYCGIQDVIITSSASAGGSSQTGLLLSAGSTVDTAFHWINSRVYGTFLNPVTVTSSNTSSGYYNGTYSGGGVDCLTPRSSQVGFSMLNGENNTFSGMFFNNCTLGYALKDTTNWLINPSFAGNTTDFDAYTSGTGINGAYYSGMIGGGITTAVTIDPAVNPSWTYVGTYVISGIVNQIAGSNLGVNTVTYSATPNFNLALGTVQKITLTGNVTSWTVSNIPTGVTVNFLVCQDGTGSRTMASPPASVHGFMTIGSTLSECSAQSFLSTGSALYATSAGATNQ